MCGFSVADRLSCGMSIPRAELLEQLHEHWRHLASSAIAFDQGEHSEAKRLAVTIRGLVHDTTASHSLLGQLGQKDTMDFAAMNKASEDRPSVFFMGNTLELITGGGTIPIVREPLRWVNFETWWKETIAKDEVRGTTHRRSMILDLTNKGGGAHVDPQADNSYRTSMATPPYTYYSEMPDGTLEPAGSPHPYYAPIRTIAEELHLSLDRASRGGLLAS